MRTLLVALCVPLGIMLSPESLVLLGNLAGENGDTLLLPIFAAAGLAGLCAFAIYHPDMSSNHSSDTSLMTKVLGPFLTSTLLLASRIPLTLLAATAVLVSAGFAFNEIFLYWFPNFGFAFLLLFLIMTANLIGKQWALMLQCLAAGTALACLLTLIVWGFFFVDTQVMQPQTTLGISPYLALSSSVLFIGYDLGLPARASRLRVQILFVLGLLLLLFSCWAELSARFVAWTTLAESTIPHIQTAKKMIGQPGRLLIGATVISGAVAMVNGLFILSGKSWRELTEDNLVPRFVQGPNQERIYFGVCTVIIGVLMITGLAGEEKLEIYFRGALLLWLLKLGAHCLAAGRYLRESHPFMGTYCPVVSCMFFLVVVGLSLLDPNAVQLSSFTLLTLAGAAGLSVVWQQVARRYL